MTERKCYVGTKIIQAEPGEREGIPGYIVYYPDGYESWSPKDTFERAYRPIYAGEAELITEAPPHDAQAEKPG